MIPGNTAIPRLVVVAAMGILGVVAAGEPPRPPGITGFLLPAITLTAVLTVIHLGQLTMATPPICKAVSGSYDVLF